MAVETELKLRIAPEHLLRLRRHPLIRKYQLTRPVTRRIYNIYFDTPRLKLHKSAMALRLRRINGKWLQTLKGGGTVKAGLHQRHEWEIPVARAVLDFSSPQLSECRKILPQLDKLQPVFVTDFFRTSRMLDWQGTHIELSMDHGEICADQHSIRLCELELELKSGEPGHLFEFAMALLDIVPLEMESVSKAEHGYRLLSGYVDSPFRGLMPELSQKDTLMEMLQKLIWSCLMHLQGNLGGAMTSENTEYLHQMRVALRRLRVALQLTEKFHADESLGILRNEVAELCIALGSIREWDVFIAQTLQPACAQFTGHVGLELLLQASNQKRAELYAELRDMKNAHAHTSNTEHTVKKRSIQRLMLRIALWMNGPYWRQNPLQVPARDFISRRMQSLIRKFVLVAQQLDGLDEPRLHTLRIKAKKLRYSMEFFAHLYGRKKARLFIDALSEVQEVLGQINDVTIAQRLLDNLMAMSPDHREPAALIRGWVARSLTDQFVTLRKAVGQFRIQAKS